MRSCISWKIMQHMGSGDPWTGKIRLPSLLRISGLYSGMEIFWSSKISWRRGDSSSSLTSRSKSATKDFSRDAALACRFTSGTFPGALATNRFVEPAVLLGSPDFQACAGFWPCQYTPCAMRVKERGQRWSESCNVEARNGQLMFQNHQLALNTAVTQC